jgi:hypothetical protein
MNKELLEDLFNNGFNPKYDYCALGIRYPTLSELIEKCGDTVILAKYQKYSEERGCYTIYEAGSYYDNYDQLAPNFDTIGETAEEAIAKLWLKLNA